MSITSTTITLEWDPPLFVWGRNDTMYILRYQVAESNQEDNSVREGPTVSTTMGIITGKLQRITQSGLHLFFPGLIFCVQYNTYNYVSAINGVSDQVERNMSSLVSTFTSSCCPHCDSGVSSYPSHAIRQCDMSHVSKDLCVTIN